MTSDNKRDFNNTLIKITCSAAVLITTLTAMSLVGEFSPHLKDFYSYDLHTTFGYIFVKDFMNWLHFTMHF